MEHRCLCQDDPRRQKCQALNQNSQFHPVWKRQHDPEPDFPWNINWGVSFVVTISFFDQILLALYPSFSGLNMMPFSVNQSSSFTQRASPFSSRLCTTKTSGTLSWAWAWWKSERSQNAATPFFLKITESNFSPCFLSFGWPLVFQHHTKWLSFWGATQPQALLAPRLLRIQYLAQDFFGDSHT